MRLRPHQVSDPKAQALQGQHLLLPSNVYHTIENTRKCLSSGAGGKKNIAALLCLLLARGMFGTCDIMKLQSTAKCLSPSSKLKGKAGWLQPASSRLLSTQTIPPPFHLTSLPGSAPRSRDPGTLLGSSWEVPGATHQRRPAPPPAQVSLPDTPNQKIISDGNEL